MRTIINNVEEVNINDFVDDIKQNNNIGKILFIRDIASLSLKNREKTIDILRAFKFCYPTGTTIIRTENSLQNLLSENDEDIKSMLIYLDYLIDKSYNDCFIDIQQSMKEGHIITLNVLDKDILDK